MKHAQEKLVIGFLILLFISAIVVRSVPQIKTMNSASLSTTSKDAVAIIPLYGMIKVGQSDFFPPSGVDSVLQAFRSAEKDDAVKAVVLRINSPGGYIGSSQSLYHAILSFKERTQKPVVVSVVDYGASGAYWVALAGDAIFAQAGSLVGSMGVISQVMDLTHVKEKYGIGMTTYKAGKMKDIMNPWRKMTTKEKKVTYRMLHNIHRQFISVLVERRKIPKKQAQTLADGRVYTGEQALARKLIDQLGGLEEAIAHAATLAGIEGEPRVIRKYRMDFREFVDSFRTQFLGTSMLPIMMPQFPIVR